MLEFGARKGLAVRLPDQTEQIRYEAQLKRQAKLAAEQKAKLFADDFDYNNAMNPHDNPLVKQFAIGKLTEIGRFIHENPGWETDPFARSKYKTMIHELKDNPDLNRGLLSDNHFKLWQEDMAKNSDEVDPEEWKAIHNQWNNYLKFGHQEGAEAAQKYGKQSFKYNAPKNIDYVNEYLMKIANETNYDKILPAAMGYQAGYKETVTSAQRRKAAELAISQTNKYTIRMRKEYEKEGGDKVFGTFGNWAHKKMDPLFKEDKYNMQNIPEWARPGSGGSGGQSEAFDPWHYSTQRALSAPNTPVKANPTGVQSLLTDNNGYYNFKNAYLVNGNGNHIQIKDFVTKNATTAGSKMVYRKTADPKDPGKFAITATVRMPVEQFETLFDDKYDSFQWQNPGDWFGNAGVESQYKEYFKQYTDIDDKGNKQEYVEFDINQDYDPYDRSHAPKYNFGAGVTREKGTSADEAVVATMEDGSQWLLDSSGSPIRQIK